MNQRFVILSLSLTLTFGLGLGLRSTPALADDQEVDVRAFEYVDVVETTDGSVWKGVLVEQTPNVQYKIATAGGSLHVIKAADVLRLSRQRNRDYRSPALATSSSARPHAGEHGVAGTYERPSPLPAPFATSGLRVEPELVFVFPTGPLGKAKFPTSFAPGARIGYEHLFGNFGLAGGGHVRFAYWRMPGETMDAMWTLETQLYARAALHVGRAMPYLGMTLGLDTNYIYSDLLDESNTSVGFGMNLQTGVAVAATPALALELGFDYHPGTDTISDLAAENESISYWGLRMGMALRM